MAGQRAVALAAAPGDVSLQIEANQLLGQVYHALGDYPRAVACFGRAVASIPSERRYERFALSGLLVVQGRVWLVWSLAEQGRFAEGRTFIDEAVRLAEQVEHTITLLHAYFGVGVLSLRQGDLGHPRPRTRPGIVSKPAGAGLLCSVCLRLRSGVGSVRSDHRGPTATGASGRAEYSRGYRLGYAPCLTHLGEAHLLAGRIEEARRYAERGLEYSQAHQERGYEVWALRLLGDIAVHQGSSDAVQAEAAYRQALALAEELGLRPLQAHCHRGLGTLYARTAQREQAHAALSTARELYGATDMRCWLPQAEAMLVQVQVS